MHRSLGLEFIIRLSRVRLAEITVPEQPWNAASTWLTEQKPHTPIGIKI